MTSFLDCMPNIKKIRSPHAISDMGTNYSDVIKNKKAKLQEIISYDSFWTEALLIDITKIECLTKFDLRGAQFALYDTAIFFQLLESVKALNHLEYLALPIEGPYKNVFPKDETDTDTISSLMDQLLALAPEVLAELQQEMEKLA